MKAFLYQSLATIIGVTISALIAWIVYKQQEKIRIIQSDISNFFYIFFLVIRNFEEIINMWTNYTKVAIQEINNAIKAIENIKIVADKLHGKEKVSEMLELSPLSEQEILMKQLKNEETFLNLKVSTQKFYWHVEEKDFSKEALFLTKYGDAKFQAITTILNSVYILINKLLYSITNDIDESRTRPAKLYNILIIGDISDENYEETLMDYKYRLEYKLSLFTTLNEQVEKGIIYSRNALEHMQKFYKLYKNKYDLQLRFIGVKYKEFGLANEIISKDKYEKLLNTRNEFEKQYWDIPDFKNLKPNWIEKLCLKIFFY